MILIHSFQFLLQLIEQEVNWKQRWLPNFQIWKNFARESDVTSVLYSIPGNMGVYEQTRVVLLQLPKKYCSKKMNVTLVRSTFIISLHFIAVEFIHLYSIIAVFSNFRFFYHHRAFKYLAQHNLLIKFPTGGKNLPYYDQHLQMWVETFPWRSQNCILPKVSQCQKMPENPIPNLITMLTLLAVFISWHFSLSLYFNGAIAYLDISRHSFPYLHTLSRVVCQSESSMKSQSELRISYSRGG